MQKITWAKVSKINKDDAIFSFDGKLVTVPKDQVLGRLIIGEKHLIIYWNTENGKFEGSERINDHLSEIVPEDKYFKNQKIKATIYQETDLGFNVSFDSKYRGIIYKNEIFDEIKLGVETEMYIKKVREDLRVDLSLEPIGYLYHADDTQKNILSILKKSGGFLALSDKSSPEDIRKKFSISKNKFKNTIGTLYKDKKILFDKDGIRLNR